MTAPEPTQPITDADLARMDRELTVAVVGDGEWYLTTCAPRDMRRLLDEVDRLRTKLESLSKVYKIINDAHEYKSIQVYEMGDRLDDMEPKLKAVTEFATSEPEQTGHCGSPSHTHWCHRHAHMEAREQVSRALGLDQSGEGQTNA